MTETFQRPDTFQRSLDHWSETGRREMESFYALASVDYSYLAEAQDWKGWFEARQAEAGTRQLRLLDVACGSGKFPAALVRDAAINTASIRPVDYALLDPSPFSISEARQALSAPFEPGEQYQTKLQDLECEAGSFDIVWATHALYALPEAELEDGLRRFMHALRKNGRGFIAHACEDAHYISFYRRFLDAFRGGAGVPYTSAEQIEGTLTAMGVGFDTHNIFYENGASENARLLIEGYLQRCVFDDTTSLDQMLARPETGGYLESCRVDGWWRFSQRVKLIFIRA